ncbi:MAG: response regulator [Sedimentisphaerales bacterium]|nr:response regulator [Sedimentisphaerales bacterium]
MAFKILIVDDSFVTRSVLRKTIAMTGVEVDEIFEAGDGIEALDVLSGNQVDLVMTDINMPRMNGMEMTAAILANKKTCDIPVVIVTTHSDDTRINELCVQGVKKYIHKPFTPEKIRDTLQEVREAIPQ